MTTVRNSVLAAAAALSLSFSAVPGFAADDLIATAEKAGSFKTLVAAIKAAGLAETLTGKGPFTVFAPTDDAFKKLPAGTLERLLKPESKAQLAAILKYHVLPGAYSAERLKKAKAREYTVKTAEGEAVLFDKKDGLTIDGAKIAKTDIGASNGTIHIIDSVILPPSVKKEVAKAASAASAAKAVTPAAKPEAPKAAEPAKGGQPVGPAAKTEPKTEAAKPDVAKSGSGKAEAGKPADPKPVIPAVPAQKK